MKEGAASFVDTIIYIAGGLGAVLVLISIYKLWDAGQKGENSRETTFKCLLGIVIGSMVAIFSLVMFVIQNTAAGR